MNEWMTHVLYPNKVQATITILHKKVICTKIASVYRERWNSSQLPVDRECDTRFHRSHKLWHLRKHKTLLCSLLYAIITLCFSYFVIYVSIHPSVMIYRPISLLYYFYFVLWFILPITVALCFNACLSLLTAENKDYFYPRNGFKRAMEIIISNVKKSSKISNTEVCIKQLSVSVCLWQTDTDNCLIQISMSVCLSFFYFLVVLRVFLLLPFTTK